MLTNRTSWSNTRINEISSCLSNWYSRKYIERNKMRSVLQFYRIKSGKQLEQTWCPQASNWTGNRRYIEHDAHWYLWSRTPFFHFGSISAFLKEKIYIDRIVMSYQWTKELYRFSTTVFPCLFLCIIAAWPNSNYGLKALNHRRLECSMVILSFYWIYRENDSDVDWERRKMKKLCFFPNNKIKLYLLSRRLQNQKTRKMKMEIIFEDILLSLRY